MLISCERKSGGAEEDPETLMTQQSDSLTIIASENGRKSYRFFTPLMERYELAREPYMEFRKGVDVVTYADSTGMVESTLVADYAIFFENQKLWEAKGNVVATNAKGQILETQQLFWNQKTHKIYSNVDSKVTQGTDVIVGVGFESDEDFEDFTFRRPKGKVTVDTEPTRGADSTAVESPATDSAKGSTAGGAVAPAKGNGTNRQLVKPRPLRHEQE